MTRTICTLLLTGAALLPLNAYAYAQTMGTQITVSTSAAHNLSQDELNAIKTGNLTNGGQQIPVETKIMMSKGNLDGYTIGRIQQSLAQRGYYKGAISGTWDAETTAALQNFQRASGDQIDETGAMISSSTLASLGVSMDKLTSGDGARVNGSRVGTNVTTTPVSRTSTNASYNPYNSSTVKSLGTVQMAANGDTPVGTYVSNSKMSAPGQTVAAPDNGSKSTITRDAVASGRFNKTIDGSPARGTTDGTSARTAATPNNSMAGTRASTRVNSNNIASTPAVGSTSLSAGSTSSANIQMTGSLTDSAAPAVSNGSRYGNGLEPDNSTALSNAGIAPAAGNSLGGRSTTTGTLSNSGSVAATGTTSGIANSGGSLSGDGRSANTSSLSGGSTSAGSGSLSGSGGASGGGGAGGGGL